MLSNLCVAMGITAFSADALDKRLRDTKCQLWHGRDFLCFNVTLSSAKLVSVDNGLVGLVAKAVGLEHYASLHTKEQVLHWYQKCPRDRVRGGR
jgi:hypothetical protein